MQTLHLSSLFSLRVHGARHTGKRKLQGRQQSMVRHKDRDKCCGKYSVSLDAKYNGMQAQYKSMLAGEHNRLKSMVASVYSTELEGEAASLAMPSRWLDTLLGRDRWKFKSMIWTSSCFLPEKISSPATTKDQSAMHTTGRLDIGDVPSTGSKPSKVVEDFLYSDDSAH